MISLFSNFSFRFELVFFDRPNLDTVFALAMRKIAVKTLVFDVNDVEHARGAIRDEDLDVLLYMALPTEKFSVFLAQSR
jgi:hypothetical protein